MLISTFRWLKRLLTLSVLAIALYAGYEFYMVRTEGYPRNTYLLDKHYRSIPVRLEGRTATHVHATRRDTQKYFIYAIGELHPLNQWWMRLYPEAPMINGANENQLSSTHAEQTLAERARLIEAIKKLQAQVETAESDSQRRTLEQEIKRKLEKIRTLETSLERHGIQHKAYDHTQGAGSMAEKLTELFDKMLKRATTGTE